LLFHHRHGPSTANDAAQTAHGGSLGLVLVATGMAMFLVDLDFFALNLSVPRMAEDLDTSATNMQWVISGYMLALAAFLIPGGRLGDILGRKRMLIIGLAIFGGGAVLSGTAQSAGVLIGFRIVQGIGAAILFPICIAVVTNAFPPERRKRAIGNLYGIGALATAVGPFIGGAVTDELTWRWVLLLQVPVAGAAIALALIGVRESRDRTVPRHIDLPGLLAVALGIAALTFAIDRGQDWGWGSGATMGTFAAGIALLVGFVAIERRVKWPLIDLSLIRNVPYVVVTLAGMVANTCFVVTLFAATLYLQQVEGYSPIVAGVIFLAASATVAVAGPLSGVLAEHFDVPRLMGVAIVVGAVGLFAISTGGALGVYLPGLAVFGIGYGLCWSLSSIGTQTVVSPDRAGEASGVMLTIVVGVAGLGVALAAALIEIVSGGGTGQGDAIEGILRVLAIGSGAIGIVLALVHSRAPRRTAADTA
jgi:EmrB/QacA subfamily drug resistance transporter